MNVLNVIHYPVFGGPHNQVLRTADLLAARGWRSTTLLPDEPGSGARRLRGAGVDVVQRPLHRLRAKADPRLHAQLALGLLPEVAEIRRLIRARDVDVVKVSGLLNPHAGIAARLEDRPVVWQIVDSRPPPLVRKGATAVALRLADAFMFTGRTLAELHGAARIRQPWMTYYPPVDTAAFAPDPGARREVRAALGIPAGAPVVGTVANLNPQKGVDHLLRSAGAVLAAVPEAWFLIVGASYAGHARHRALLDAEAARQGIPAGRVIFTGAVTDPQRYYAAMDVKVVSSRPRSEGIPTTALEAMACGVPVVATGVGAVAEVVAHGRTGFVVPPLDTEAMAAAVAGLLRDRPRRDAMGARARRAAVAAFSAAACSAVMVRAFDAAREYHRARRAAASRGRPSKASDA